MSMPGVYPPEIASIAPSHSTYDLILTASTTITRFLSLPLQIRLPHQVKCLPPCLKLAPCDYDMFILKQLPWSADDISRAQYSLFPVIWSNRSKFPCLPSVSPRYFSPIARLRHPRTDFRKFYGIFRFQSQLRHSPRSNRGKPSFLDYFPFPRSDFLGNHGNHS